MRREDGTVAEEGRAAAVPFLRALTECARQKDVAGAASAGQGGETRA